MSYIIAFLICIRSINKFFKVEIIIIKVEKALKILNLISVISFISKVFVFNFLNSKFFKREKKKD